MLGVQQTSVTAGAGALQNAKLIHYGHGMITIVNRLGLEQRACEMPTGGDRGPLFRAQHFAREGFMKFTCMIALFLSLSGSVLAAQPMSRADHMKTCAEQWKMKKPVQPHSLRYQKFMSDCMKSIAAKAPAHA